MIHSVKPYVISFMDDEDYVNNNNTINDKKIK